MSHTPPHRSIEYYYDKNRFFNLLLTSGKWKDLLCSKEAVLSCLLTIVTMWFVHANYQAKVVPDFCNFLSNLLITLSAGLLGVLGFLVGGQAIISGTISNKILKCINEDAKFNHIINIVFAFYLNGAILGLTLVVFIFSILILNTNWIINDFNVYVATAIDGYLFWFTVIYAVMLLGTILRLMILSYFYEYGK